MTINETLASKAIWNESEKITKLPIFSDKEISDLERMAQAAAASINEFKYYADMLREKAKLI
jgi:hypothetical protein